MNLKWGREFGIIYRCKEFRVKSDLAKWSSCFCRGVMAKEPEKIGNVILKTLRRMGFAERLHKQSAVTRWKEIVGEKIAVETEALRIEGSTLIVRVHQAAWRQQLTYLKEELLEKLKAELGDDSIEDIRFI